MVEKLILICWFGVLLICGCTEKQVSPKDELIRKIVQEDALYPSLFAGNVFFVTCISGDKCLLNVYQIRELFESSQSKSSYQAILRNLFSQEYLVSCSEEYTCFEIDKNVEKEYSKASIKEFLRKYFIKIDNDLYILNRSEVTENMRNSLFYYAFVNNYMVSFDDYSGSYSIILQSFNKEK